MKAVNGNGNGHWDREHAAKEALVAYLRLLAACIHEEADMIEAFPDRAGEVLRRFRSEVLEMSLGDAPVEALLQRARPLRSGEAT